MRKTQSAQRMLVLGVAVVGLASACVSPSPSGVRIKGYPADLIFGVKPIVAALPAEALVPGQPAPTPQVISQPETLLPPQDFPAVAPSFPTGPQTELQPPVLPCPAAAENAFASAPPGATVPLKTQPKPGTYRWKRMGTEAAASTAGVAIALHGFEQRVIRRIQDLGSSTNTTSLGVPGSSTPRGQVFSFQTVQPSLDGGTVVTTFKVDTEPENLTVSEGVGTPTVRQGPPDRGISIIEIDHYDSAGAPVSSFKPPSNGGVLLLPLEVRQGDSFQSVSVDPATEVTYTYSGLVTKEMDVDACGTIISSWLVTGKMTVAGAQSATYGYDVAFATEFGGYPVYEHLNENDANGKLDIVGSIGQLNPGPLPAGQP